MKIVETKILAEKVGRARSNGETIVFTNGAFDLLHVGHIRYLEGAAALGDRVVCALNSDESIRGLKGPGRPIVPLVQRMEIVAALYCVDWVTSFDEPTVENLLLLLKPDIHAKGSDYTKETVPEVDVVKSYGGKVAITGDPKNHDTSAMIDQIRNRTEEAS